MQQAKATLGSRLPYVQLEVLRLFRTLTGSPTSSKEPGLVTQLCMEDTFTLLLKAVSRDDRKANIARDAGLFLQSGEDSALLLALVTEDTVAVVASTLATTT